MANGISNVETVRTLAFVKNTGQVARGNQAAAPQRGGESLPQEGKVPPEKVANPAGLGQAVDRINSVIQNVQRDLSFNLDEDSGRTVIRVVDSKSGKLIRQIPSEEVLALVRHLQSMEESVGDQAEMTQGIIFSEVT